MNELMTYLDPEDVSLEVRLAVPAIGRVIRGTERIGTAFIVREAGRNFLLTAFHCVRDDPQVDRELPFTITFPSGARIVRSPDEFVNNLSTDFISADVAISEVGENFPYPLSFSRREMDNLLRLPSVAILGHPGNFQREARYDSVIASVGHLQEIDEEGRLLITCRCEPGFSGAPVLDDRGRVIGIALVQRVSDMRQLLGYGISTVIAFPTSRLIQPLSLTGS